MEGPFALMAIRSETLNIQRCPVQLPFERPAKELCEPGGAETAWLAWKLHMLRADLTWKLRPGKS